MKRALSLMTVPAAALAFAAFALNPEAAQTKKADDYEVTATAGDALEAGDKGTYELTITPKGDRVLKMETPLKVFLNADPDIELEKTKLGKDDVVDPKSEAKTLAAPFVCKGAGQHKITADATFFLCNEKSCNRYKEKVELQVEVAAAK